MSDKLRTKQINYTAIHRATPSDQLQSGHKFILCLPPYRTVSAVQHTRFFCFAILVAVCSSRCHQASQQRRTCPCTQLRSSLGGTCTGHVMCCRPSLLSGNTASTWTKSRTIHHIRCPIHYCAHYMQSHIQVQLLFSLCLPLLLQVSFNFTQSGPKSSIRLVI